MGSIDLWVKSAHIFFIIAWMVVLLYLPRLLVYHTDAEVGSEQSEIFKIMQRRLLKGIGTPSMIAAWVFGIWLASLYGFWGEVWLWVKLVAVLTLTGIHMFLASAVKAFAEDKNIRTARFYRVINEVPAVLLIIIITMVVVKPF